MAAGENGLPVLGGWKEGTAVEVTCEKVRPLSVPAGFGEQYGVHACVRLWRRRTFAQSRMLGTRSLVAMSMVLSTLRTLSQARSLCVCGCEHMRALCSYVLFAAISVIVIARRLCEMGRWLSWHVLLCRCSWEYTSDARRLLASTCGAVSAMARYRFAMSSLEIRQTAFHN